MYKVSTRSKPQNILHFAISTCSQGPPCDSSLHGSHQPSSVTFKMISPVTMHYVKCYYWKNSKIWKNNPTPFTPSEVTKFSTPLPFSGVAPLVFRHQSYHWRMEGLPTCWPTGCRSVYARHNQSHAEFRPPQWPDGPHADHRGYVTVDADAIFEYRPTVQNFQIRMVLFKNRDADTGATLLYSTAQFAIFAAMLNGWLTCSLIGHRQGLRSVWKCGGDTICFYATFTLNLFFSALI